MIDQDLLDALKRQIVPIVDDLKIVYEQSLKFMMENLPGDIELKNLAISEAVQDNLIQRIEIQFPNSREWMTVYLPLGTKIR